MKINNFEDIIAWKKAKELSILIYRIFKSNRDFAFRDQIRRAAISIMNSIAEGFERQSNKEFKTISLYSKRFMW
jgi:four helix bundle protein